MTILAILQIDDLDSKGVRLVGDGICVCGNTHSFTGE